MIDWVQFYMFAQVAVIAYAVGRLAAYSDGYEEGYLKGWNEVAERWKAYEEQRQQALEEQWKRLYGRYYRSG